MNAMYNDGATFTGGTSFDGIGNALSATLLGSSQTFNGFQFSLGLANVANAVKNSTIPLPSGQYNYLLMLAAAVNGNQAAQSFTLNYTDGTSKVFTQSISDWATPASYSGEYGSSVMAYRNTFTGGRDSAQQIHVYAYAFPVDGSKIPASWVLPANNNVGILAITLVQLGMQNELRKQVGYGPVILMDVQSADGATFFWSDFEGTFPGLMVSGNQNYSPWIKSAGPFKSTRDLSTDTADLVIQNLSGNSIDRDAAGVLGDHEFEGALCIVRIFHPFYNDVIDRFDYSLTEESPSEDEVSFRMLQLFDSSQYDVAADIQTDTCTWRYKEKACGSTGSATTCLKRFIDCSDATRAATERHNAILSIVPNATLVHITSGGGGGGGGDTNGGRVGGGGGNDINPLRG
jgi:hypothetical protein